MPAALAALGHHILPGFHREGDRRHEAAALFFAVPGVDVHVPAVQAPGAVVRVPVTGDGEAAVAANEVFFCAPEGQGHGSGIIAAASKTARHEKTRLGGFCFLLVALGRFGFRFRLVHGAGRVLSRSVDGVEFHRFGAGVAEIVSGSSGDEDEVTGGDGLGLPADGSLTTAGRDDDDLVYGMNLFADILAGGQAHEYDLAVLAGVDLSAEILTASTESRDVFDVNHRSVRKVTFGVFMQPRPNLLYQKFLKNPPTTLRESRQSGGH